MELVVLEKIATLENSEEVLNAVRMDAFLDLWIAMVMLAVIFLVYRNASALYEGLTDTVDMIDPEIVAILAFTVGFVMFVISMITVLSFKTWLAIFNPDLALMMDLLNG